MEKILLILPLIVQILHKYLNETKLYFCTLNFQGLHGLLLALIGAVYQPSYFNKPIRKTKRKANFPQLLSHPMHF